MRKILFSALAIPALFLALFFGVSLTHTHHASAAASHTNVSSDSYSGTFSYSGPVDSVDASAGTFTTVDYDWFGNPTTTTTYYVNSSTVYGGGLTSLSDLHADDNVDAVGNILPNGTYVVTQISLSSN